MKNINNTMKGSSGKSSIKSGIERGQVVANAGGMPSEKSIKEINKCNSPAGRKKAPGSVRV